jgi:carbon storage regulator
MLVLTRKQSETIYIGEDVVIKVIQTGRGSIKLGIEAPSSIRVLRGEVADEATNAGAAAPQVSTRVARPTRPANKAGTCVHFGAV